MCFLKTLKPLDEIKIEKQNNSETESQVDCYSKTCSESSFLNEMIFSERSIILTKHDQILMKMLNMAHTNKFFIEQMNKKLQKNEQQIQDCFQIFNTMEIQTQRDISCQQQKKSIEKIDHQEYTTVDPLISKLFGKNKYEYKLQIKEALPSIIYKERNINIQVNLVNDLEKTILNSNIVHLCLGVCDQNGQWISQNKAGECFMKGKTEVQLYHGQGNFLKIYPRDVSRHYHDGKVNFIIYSKPSMIKFSNNASSVQQIVESNLIEPLIIRDITIKAKKKD